METDFGEGIAIDHYIHGIGEITSAEDAVHPLSFNLYDTQQKIDLIQWMHDYNLTATADQ